jgi:hypothetical protein
LIRDEHTPILNEMLWELVLCLPGSPNPKNPQSYQTEEFGIVSKARITKICQDKFGAIKGHDGHKRSLVFSKNVIEKLKDNYSQINEITILGNNSTTNTPNTFNTFWKGVGRNDTFKNNFNVIEATKSGLESDEYEENSESSADNSSNSPIQIMEVKDEYPTKVLKVLENQERLEYGKEQLKDGIDQVVNDSSHIANLSYALPNYIYTV